MNWIHEFDKQFQWHSVHFTEAAEYGDLGIMTWMKTNGCPWTSSTFSCAARYCDGTNFEVLEWLRINNCPWDDYTFFKNMIKQPAVHEWLLNHAMTLN